MLPKMNCDNDMTISVVIKYNCRSL